MSLVVVNNKFERLNRTGIITQRALNEVIEESKTSGRCPEELLMEKGIPRHEILFCLSEYYGYPFVEYDESVMASYFLTIRLNMGKLKNALWFPLSVLGNKAEVIAYDPYNPLVVEDIKRTLRVDGIEFLVALPSDIIRIIENNFDVNPNFPPSAGRTPLAKVRTFLAERRSLLASYRTSLARGRTGLAFLRTGISFIVISLVLLRIFGVGYLTLFEAGLFITGILMIIDGIRWYMPARKTGKRLFECTQTEPTWGTTVLEVYEPGDSPVFSRTNPIEGAGKLRADWNNLSPVMRRRFLASDRTDFAEERTTLAYYRSTMARARTGLAFTRTGVAFIGLGIALLRQFSVGYWTVADIALISVGIAMFTEGFHWYVPGRRAGVEGFKAVKKTGGSPNVWDFVFPPGHNNQPQFVKKSYSPGIWATTGLALERTLLADRRNLMARLRTVMARSRTGMAFIRTGMSISAVGMGLLVYFGTGNTAWTILDVVLILTGLISIGDGLSWHIPSEKIKSQFPYCFGEMEIVVPDYGKPTTYWKKAIFSHDDL